MVTLSKIYTKTGDSGETSLGDGNRVPKHSLRVSAYGTVDETNATVGLAKLYADKTLISTQLSVIQNDLFDLGADLCRPDQEKDSEAQYQPLRMTGNQVKRLETEIDLMNKNIEPLRSFILPGGSVLSAQTQITRCICRRVERHVVGLNDPKYNLIISYLNRLSDYLFVLSREYLRLENIEEVKWKKD